jgi:hypothetical protein
MVTVSALTRFGIMLQMLVEQRRLIRSEGLPIRVSDEDELSSAASLGGALALVAAHFGYLRCLESNRYRGFEGGNICV